MNNKIEKRKELIEIRKNIKERIARSIVLTNYMLDYLSKYEVIGLYAAMPEEVNVDYLFYKLKKASKIIVMPKIIGDDLSFIRINSLHDMKIFRWNLREPISDEAFDKEKIDVILVPGLGFDKKNNRIGHGMGYYDKYLKDYKGIKIGICFKEQLLDAIPTEKHDVKMNKVITA